MAIWLLNDKYDRVDTKNYLSATSLIKPTQEIVLTDRNKSNEDEIDIEISGLAKSQMGTAMHDAIEVSWDNKYAVAKACELLGISEDIAASITINPTSQQIKKAKHKGELLTPVYMEQRTIKEFMGYSIGGKYDLVLAGDLHDYKSTGTYTYIKQSNAEKYIQQGSIYKWLNPEIITGDVLTINYYFTDWVDYRTSDPKYPPSQIMSQHFDLWTYEETEEYIKNKILEIERFKKNPNLPLPKCSDKDLWKDPSQFKYFSKPDAARATKNFGVDSAAAHAYAASKGKGIVVEAPSIARACVYCNALPHCDQAADLLKAGILHLPNS